MIYLRDMSCKISRRISSEHMSSVPKKNFKGKKPREKSIWTKIETSRHKFVLIIIYCWNRVILSWAEIRPSLCKVLNWNIKVINPAVKCLKVKFWLVPGFRGPDGLTVTNSISTKVSFESIPLTNGFGLFCSIMTKLIFKLSHQPLIWNSSHILVF